MEKKGLKEVIRESVDIVEVASRYLTINRVGRRYQALCPFHNERTPSFSLDPAKQSYFCFGCGAKGDVYSLLMNIEGITFPEAIKMLKEELGINKKGWKPKVSLRPEIKNEKLDDPTLHDISCDLLQALDLSHEHEHHLNTVRQMSKDMILVNGYRSFPEKPWSPFTKMKKRDYTGFPGAYIEEGKKGPYWLLSNVGKGILIPFRNQYNYIIGWQIRLDKPKPILYVKTPFKEQFKAHLNSGGLINVTWNGEIIEDLAISEGESKKLVSRGIELGEIGLKKGTKYRWLSSIDKKNGTGAGEPTPVHIAVPSKERKKWLPGHLIQARKAGITEGPIKADTAAELLNMPFVSVAGVAQCMKAVKVLLEMGVTYIVLAFDMDIARKNELLEQIRILKNKLQNITQFKHCDVFIWSEDGHGKGIDDCLNNGFMPKTEKLF